MKHICVVMQSEDDYDYHSSNPIYSTFDHIKAEAKVAEMNELKKRVLEAKEKLAAHTDAWRLANPQVLPKTAKLKPEPSFPGKKKNWTKEQHAELKVITKSNFDAAVEASRPALEWANRLHKEYQAFTESLPQDIQDNLLYISRDTQFDIAEVPFEE